MKRSLNQNYRWVILIMCFLTLTCGYTYMSVWSMIIPELMEEFGITSATAQLGNSFLFAGYALSSLLLPMLAGKIGRKRASSLGLVLFLIGTFGIPLCSSYPLILFLRMLQGSGIVWSLNVGIATAWCSAKSRGFASGLVGGGLCAGSGFGGWYAAMLWKLFPNWREAFFNGGYMFLLFIVLFLILVKDAPADLYPEEMQTRAEATTGKKKKSVWKYPGMWLCGFSMFLASWGCMGFQTVLPDYCYSIGYSMDQAGAALLIMGILGIALTPIGGYITDIFVRRGCDPMKARAYLWTFGGFVPTIIVLITFPFLAPISFSVVIAMILVQSTCAPFGNVSIGATPMDMTGDPELADKMLGSIIVIGICGGVISPYVISAVQNSAGWIAAWIVAGLGAAAGAVTSFIMPKFREK